MMSGAAARSCSAHSLRGGEKNEQNHSEKYSKTPKSDPGKGALRSKHTNTTSARVAGCNVA